MDHRSWQYDELKQVGTDYNDLAEIEAYDARHAQFRDVDGDSEAILDALAVSPASVVIDLGAGTGTFAIHAARRCAKVYAVDVSRPMLEYAGRKAEAAGAANIAFRHGGFLTYDHEGERADAIATCMALHHLPDFWKGVALRRMNGMLKPGGRLCIHDVIFEAADWFQNISRWIDELAAIGGATLRAEIEAHLREEHSTFDWIIEGLLERAGFKIEDRRFDKGVVGAYLCAKKDEVATLEK